MKVLQNRKAELEEGITQMSVTLYTTRAQNQMRGYTNALEEIDRTITVFERPRVYIEQ